MQIVIPMSGFGERFRKVGYDIPKPLIRVNNKPLIQHVVEMFPGENDFTFICNRDHIREASFKMRKTLEELSPEGRIIEIDPHKLGPVHAVLQAIDYIDLSLPTIVNYADFSCFWNYKKFLETIKNSDCDGAIPAYKGFHPHSLKGNYYAYIRETDKWVSDIQEKKPFTNNPTEEFASSGTYYFRSGHMMKDYFQKTIEEDLKVANEYYVSMAYKPMIADKLRIQVYELQHFMQWGTPEDLEEYNYWSDTFYSIENESKPPLQAGTLMIPMAGTGSRFKERGYNKPKPSISVSGKPMVIQAICDLPITDKQRYILSQENEDLKDLTEGLLQTGSNPSIEHIDSLTDGQATTCIKGSVNIDKEQPITIAPCDNGLIYDAKKFQELFSRDDVDIIVWGAKSYPGAIKNPKMYGWIETDEDSEIIKSISVKKPLKDTKNDAIVVGAFTFKKHNYFLESVKKMKEREGLVNGEYYVDSCINDAIELGYKCVIFNVDKYICWGTPDDLTTFEYWQFCFHEWHSHSYRLEKDTNIQKSNLDKVKKDLSNKFYKG